MDEHASYAQHGRHGAGVLAARAAEAVECVAAEVVAFLNGDLANGTGHVLVRDRKKTLGDLLGSFLVARARQLSPERLEFVGDSQAVERLITAGPEYLRKEIRLDAAQKEIRVRYRQWAAASVAGRSRIGAGRTRTHAQAPAVEVEQRAASGRDRLDR